MERGSFYKPIEQSEQRVAQDSTDAARKRIEQSVSGSVERKERGQENKETPSVTQSDRNALAAAQDGINEHLDDYTKAQGCAVERAALYKMRDDGKVTDLNARLGNNFPIYDVASDKQVASVKCHGLNDGATLSEGTRNAYLRDFEEAVGQGTSPEKFSNSARYLHENARVEGAGFPRELAASPQATEAYLRENAKLMIPDDHAVAVRNELRSRLFSNDAIEREVASRRLGLDVYAPDYDAQVLKTLDRIQGAGIYSFEVKQMLDKTPGKWH